MATIHPLTIAQVKLNYSTNPFRTSMISEVFANNSIITAARWFELLETLDDESLIYHLSIYVGKDLNKIKIYVWDAA